MKLYGQDLIEQKLAEQDASHNQLAKKMGHGESWLARKCKFPGSWTAREIRLLAVLLNFTAEEIYNSFILMKGWPNTEEELGYGIGHRDDEDDNGDSL